MKKVIIIVLCVLLICSALTAGFFAYRINLRVKRFNDEYSAYKYDAQDKIAQLDSEIDALESANSELSAENDRLESKLNKTVDEKNALKIKLDEVEKTADKNNPEIIRLNELNSALISEINKFKNKTDLDVSNVVKLVNELENYVCNASPLVRVKLTEQELQALINADPTQRPVDHTWKDADTYFELGKRLLGEKYNQSMSNKKVLECTEAKMPEIAVYYENLSTGFVYTYNADKVAYSASVMKAPYILSVLMACDQYENGEILPEDVGYSEDSLKKMFNLNEKIALDHETMDVVGSGVIKNLEDGTEFTYTELIEYALSKSDNIAFSLIKNKFTSKWYYKLIDELGVVSPLTHDMYLTARETGVLFKELYYFTVENNKYGALMRESLTDSSHTVLAKQALSQLDVAHKYGWDIDSYHDAAIVYGDSPYIAIVFTNIDCGGLEADEYIREIFKKIDNLHNALS